MAPFEAVDPRPAAGPLCCTQSSAQTAYLFLLAWEIKCFEKRDKW